MNNLEKIYLVDKIVYQKAIGNKTNTQGVTYDTPAECWGKIEDISIRIANGNIIKDTYFHTDLKLPLETKIKNKSDKDYYKITDINKIATGKFGIYTYFVKKA